jgi:hypothetical protein
VAVIAFELKKRHALADTSGRRRRLGVGGICNQGCAIGLARLDSWMLALLFTCSCTADMAQVNQQGRDQHMLAFQVHGLKSAAATTSALTAFNV